MQTELTRLENVRALGGTQHRRDIYRLLIGIRNCFAECILLWSVQTPLNFASIKLVHDYLVKSLRNQQISLVNSEEEKTMCSLKQLDHASAHLVVALLYSFEPFSCPGIEIDQLADADNQGKLEAIISTSHSFNDTHFVRKLMHTHI